MKLHDICHDSALQTWEFGILLTQGVTTEICTAH